MEIQINIKNKILFFIIFQCLFYFSVLIIILLFPSFVYPKDKPVDLLINDLKSSDSVTKINAIANLGILKDPKSVTPLIDLLSDEWSGYRSAAADALGEIKDSRAVKSLCKCLEDNDWGVKTNAKWALVKIGTPAVRCLIDYLNSSDSGARSYAAEALGEIMDKRSIPPLITHLQDKVYDVRKSSFKALEKMHWKPPTLQKKVYYYMANGACNDNLVKLGKEAVPTLISQLQEKDPDIRENSACALGEIGDKRAIVPLVNILTDWYSNKEVASALAKLLWKPISDKDNIRLWIAQRNSILLKENWKKTKNVLLEEMLSKEYAVIENALFAFIGIGYKEIIADLVSYLNDKGNKLMVEAYLNSGNEKLVEAAKDWTIKHGYAIRTGNGHAPIGWGSM